MFWTAIRNHVQEKLGTRVSFEEISANTPCPTSLLILGSGGRVQLWGFHDAVSIEVGDTTFNSEDSSRGESDPISWSVDVVLRLASFGLWVLPFRRRAILPADQAELKDLESRHAKRTFKLLADGLSGSVPP